MDSFFFEMWRENFFQLDFEWCSSRDKLAKIWLQAWIWPSFSCPLSKIQKYDFENLAKFAPLWSFFENKNFSKKIPSCTSLGLLLWIKNSRFQNFHIFRYPYPKKCKFFSEIEKSIILTRKVPNFESKTCQREQN